MKPSRKGKGKVIGVTPAGDNHQVVTVDSTKGQYRKKPCRNCPWRKDAVGEFPAEAFKVSAPTAYDMSDRIFGCHSSTTEKPSTCAGFLLRGAEHNLSVRLAKLRGTSYDDVSDGGHELFNSYREMAVANGVPENDVSLEKCRD